MTQQQITDINDLQAGDEVLFRDRVHPCTVVREADEPNPSNQYRRVVLQGPQGGRILIYQEDGFPNSTGGGPIDNLRRVE